VISKAQRGLAVNVAVAGGSVTNGGACASYALPQSKKGAFGQCSWSHRFVQWLQAHHNNPMIKLINLAVPATTSAWRLSHFDEVLSAHPDLLIVDYGMNVLHDLWHTLYQQVEPYALLLCTTGINDPNLGSTPEQHAQYVDAFCYIIHRLNFPLIETYFVAWAGMLP